MGILLLILIEEVRNLKRDLKIQRLVGCGASCYTQEGLFKGS